MNKYKIAIIDDCEGGREVLGELLRFLGVELFYYEHPVSFLREKQNDFNLIISDWRFRDSTLDEYLYRFNLRRLIVVSGLMGLEDIGALYILHKYFDSDKILKAVSEEIRKSDFKEVPTSLRLIS